MKRVFKIKKELERININIQEELEIIDMVEIESRSIPLDDGYVMTDIPFEKKRYYFDSFGILYPKEIIDNYYEEIN